jgi:hypothetical protein
MTDSSNSTPGALEEGVLGAIQRRLRAAFTPRAVPTFVDFAEHAPYVDMAQRYLIDHYGCAHAFFEIEAPSADVASAGRLVNIQTQIVNIIERLPAQIGQIQFIYTTNGDYRRMISEHAEYVSGWPIIDYLRQERAKLLMGESAQRLLIRSSTIMVLACLPKEVGQNGVLIELKRTGEARHSGSAHQRRGRRRLPLPSLQSGPRLGCGYPRDLRLRHHADQ